MMTRTVTGYVATHLRRARTRQINAYSLPHTRVRWVWDFAAVCAGCRLPVCVVWRFSSVHVPFCRGMNSSPSHLYRWLLVDTFVTTRAGAALGAQRVLRIHGTAHAPIRALPIYLTPHLYFPNSTTVVCSATRTSFLLPQPSLPFTSYHCTALRLPFYRTLHTYPRCTHLHCSLARVASAYNARCVLRAWRSGLFIGGRRALYVSRASRTRDNAHTVEHFSCGSAL